MSDMLKVEEYNLVDFVMKIQQGILDGYEVNDSSDDAPIQIGGGFYTIMREKVKTDTVIGSFVAELSFDTAKLQEQLKAGGEIEQMLTDSLVVDEKLHDLSMTTIPITNAYVADEVKEIEEKLSTEEFTELADKAADLIDKVDNLLVEAEAKHIEATTPVKATPKQTRGKK